MTDDLTINPLPLDQWDASLSSIIDDMNGKPINVHSLMAHNPALLKAWWNFRNYSVKGGALGKRRGELVILRVAVHMKSWYEWGSHVERSIRCGLTIEEIELVKQGGDAFKRNPAESALLYAIDELIENHGLSKSSQAALREYYSVAQIMDIIAIHGMYVILGCMINTWGLELDAHIKNKLPESVTKESFEAELARD